MDINSSYDAETNRITLNITLGLFKDYYSNFVGYVKTNPCTPKQLEIRKIGPCTVSLIFNATEDNIKNRQELSDKTTKITIDISDLNIIINDFVNSALDYKKRHTEFIPLSGYPLEDIMTDLKTALDMKRDLCFIRDYKEYLDSLKNNVENQYKYYQYMIRYGTLEYADIILRILKGSEWEEVKKEIGKKITYTEWI